MANDGVDLGFLIFAHARSGSDNLCAALDRHPSIRVCDEPFNPNHHLWNEANVDYHAEVVDAVSLYTQIRRIKERYTGFKTLDWNLPKGLNEVLLRDERMPLVLLRRRNALQSVVSHWLARTTHVWQVWEVEGPVVDRYGDLPAVPTENIERLLRDFLEVREWTDRAVSQRSPSSMIRVWYEDLYASSLQQQMKTFAHLTSFLGYPDLTYDQVKEVLGPRGKLNSAYTYSCIPNASVLDKTLGSDETGWLL